jgi:hypothetical protein
VTPPAPLTPDELRALPVGTVLEHVPEPLIFPNATVFATRVDAFGGRLQGDGWEVVGIPGPVSSALLHLYGVRWRVRQETDARPPLRFGHHRCPGVPCDEVVPDRLLACARHWLELPGELRRNVMRTRHRPITDPERAEILVGVADFYRKGNQP